MHLIKSWSRVEWRCITLNQFNFEGWIRWKNINKKMKKKYKFEREKAKEDEIWTFFSLLAGYLRLFWPLCFVVLFSYMFCLLCSFFSATIVPTLINLCYVSNVGILLSFSYRLVAAILRLKLAPLALLVCAIFFDMKH